ncbi:MAG: Rpn family recombination-promoting nuclease/putative transposase [Chlamydiota bacterium]
MIQLLDIKVDVVFKDFFGDKTHKEILESFINSVLALTGDDVVEVEEFLDPRKMRIEVGKPTTFVDISVKTKGGERYIIEMQTYNHEGLDKRLLYYLGKDYTEQLDYLKQLEAQDTTRKQIAWQDLPRVHIIAIADFHRSKSKKDGILNGNTVTETYAFSPECDQSNNHLFDHWKATLVDLKKFEDKPFDELHKYKDWWFFLLKNASRMKEEELEKLKQDPIFSMALERLERLSSDPETRKAYEESINEQRNLTAIKEASIKEGHEEGLKKGLKKGLEKGRKEGEAKVFEIAKNLLASGMPPKSVAEITDLDLEDVQALEQAKTGKP